MFKQIASANLVFLVVLIAISFALQPAGAAITEDLKLVPNDPQPGSNFGFNVGIGQGVAVVGATGAGLGGAAYLFDTTTGQQLFKLEPNDLIAGSAFGRSIAVDGNLAVIGAPNLNSTAAAYVFDMTTGDQVAKLEIATGLSSVAIHGNNVLVGSPGLNSGFGGALMFDVASGSLLQTFIDGSPLANDNLGDSVAFDGGLVAAFNRNNGDPVTFPQPSVLLFDPLTGNQLAEFAAPDIDLAGSSLAILGDRLLVGAPSIFTSPTSGIFDISDPNNISGTDLPWPGDPSVGLLFGVSATLNNEAALVSSWLSNETEAMGSGIVYMFDPDTGALLDSFRSSDAANDDLFGTSIGLFGQTLIVGAPGDPTIPGSVYLFTIPEPTTFACFAAGLALLHTRRHTGR